MYNINQRLQAHTTLTRCYMRTNINQRLHAHTILTRGYMRTPY